MLFPTFKLKAPNKKANSSEISKMTEWKNETHSQTTSNETRLQAALKQFHDIICTDYSAL